MKAFCLTKLVSFLKSIFYNAYFFFELTIRSFPLLKLPVILAIRETISFFVVAFTLLKSNWLNIFIVALPLFQVTKVFLMVSAMLSPVQ